MSKSQGTAVEASIPSMWFGAVGHIADKAHHWLAWAVWFLSLVAASAVGSGLRGASALEVAEAIGWVVGVMAIATIGALVVSRRRSLVQGWLLVVFSFLWSAGLYAYQLIEVPLADTSPGLTEARALIAIGDVSYVLGIHALLFLLLLVPAGRLPSPRWKPMPWGLALSAAFFAWQSASIAPKVVDVEAWLARSTWISNDGATTSPADDRIFAIGGLFGAVIVGLLARALWIRLEAASGEERQQLKWVLFASSGVLGWLLLWIPQPDGGWLAAAQRLLPGWAFVLLAVGLAMALFKHRLWDIDLVVRRSLVFGLLWLVIAGVYAGVAAGLGFAAGARFPVEVAVGLTVLATLLFQPARRWLEGVADRWVFGERGSPVDAINSLGEGVAGSHRPQDIAGELAGTALAALGLAWVAVDIDDSGGAEKGWANREPETVIPVVWGEERFGQLRCQPHRSEAIALADLALLEALVGQAGLAISHARLASRIVHAQEQERRRIERNIHDGAQQDLASLVAQIGIARAKGNGDPIAVETLNRIQHDAQRILIEIRELAQGIHPSVLRDGGLVAAIEDRCSRLPITVNLHIGNRLGDRRLAPDIEAAAYFCATEAISNTLKHSGSSSIDVTLIIEEGHLYMEVHDAGVGFEPDNRQTGSGLAGLSDRMRALGGELTVDSQVGQGTLVAAYLPISVRPDRPR